jgi:hypothetical protein
MLTLTNYPPTPFPVVQQAWGEFIAFTGVMAVWALPLELLPRCAPGWYAAHREHAMVYTEAAPLLLAAVVAAGWLPYPRYFEILMRYRVDILMYCCVLPATGQVHTTQGLD